MGLLVKVGMWAYLRRCCVLAAPAAPRGRGPLGLAVSASGLALRACDVRWAVHRVRPLSTFGQGARRPQPFEVSRKTRLMRVASAVDDRRSDADSTTGRPGPRSPSRTGAPSRRRVLRGPEWVEARPVVQASKCMRRSRESRGLNDGTEGASTPRAGGAQINTANMVLAIASTPIYRCNYNARR